MKKTILGIITTLMAVVVLSGCSMFAKANGVILYGEEVEIQNAVEKEQEKKKDKPVEVEQHKIKILTNDSQKVMILKEETAQSLVNKKLIREITNQEKGKSVAVSSLSKVAKGEALLFTKEKSYEFKLEDINIENKGNLIIGIGRAYADMFLIVNDEDWASLEGTEKTLALLKYDKDPGKDGLDYDVEQVQLVQIQD